jgi:hypothetical protein
MYVFLSYYGSHLTPIPGTVIIELQSLKHEYSYKGILYFVQQSATALLSFVICPAKLKANYGTGTILYLNTISTYSRTF